MKKDLIVLFSICLSVIIIFLLFFLALDNFDVSQTLDFIIYIIISIVFFPVYLFGFLLNDAVDNYFIVFSLFMILVPTIFWFGVYKFWTLVRKKLTTKK